MINFPDCLNYFQKFLRTDIISEFVNPPKIMLLSKFVCSMFSRKGLGRKQLNNIKLNYQSATYDCRSILYSYVVLIYFPK